tara:strand:+ start:26208 stop:26408 length:201 start_codon:yes stop_codon:yes gene_type:complete
LNRLLSVLDALERFTPKWDHLIELILIADPLQRRFFETTFYHPPLSGPLSYRKTATQLTGSAKGDF